MCPCSEVIQPTDPTKADFFNIFGVSRVRQQAYALDGECLLMGFSVQGSAFRNRMSQASLRAYAAENMGHLGSVPEQKLREKCTQHFVAQEVKIYILEKLPE